MTMAKRDKRKTVTGASINKAATCEFCTYRLRTQSARNIASESHATSLKNRRRAEWNNQAEKQLRREQQSPFPHA